MKYVPENFLEFGRENTDEPEDFAINDSSDCVKNPTKNKEDNMIIPEKILVPAATKAAKTVIGNASGNLVRNQKPFPPVASQVSVDVGKITEELCEHSENTRAEKHLLAATLVNAAAQGTAETVKAIVEPERDIIRGGNQQIDDFNAKILDSKEDLDTLCSKSRMINEHSEIKSRQAIEQINAEGKWRAVTCGIIGVSVVGGALVCNTKKKRSFFKRFFR